MNEPNPHNYELNIMGDPLCPHCDEPTHRKHLATPNLICWSCGKSMTAKTRSTLDQVREFSEAFSVPIADSPNVTDPDINALRVKLLREELDELRDALYGHDPVATLDALCDLQYVLDGAFLQLGFAGVKEAAFADVHRSNMAKLGPDGKPIRRADGKILKPEGWQPPNLKQFLKQFIP